MLHLEPAALRRPDEFASSARLGTDGSHLAATLYRLARSAENGKVIAWWKTQESPRHIAGLPIA